MRTSDSRYKKLFEIAKLSKSQTTSCQKEKSLASKKKFVKTTKKERIETEYH